MQLAPFIYLLSTLVMMGRYCRQCRIRNNSKCSNCYGPRGILC